MDSYLEIKLASSRELVAFGMLPRDVLTIAMVTTSLIVIVISGAPTNLDPEDYEVLADNEARPIDKGNASISLSEPSECHFMVYVVHMHIFAEVSR